MATGTQDSPCTPYELLDIITSPSGGLCMMPSDSYNEVFPNIYIGEESIAKNRVGLKRLGITHILNAAEGETAFHVNTNFDMFKRVDIDYYGIQAMDQMNFQLTPYFDKSAEFIQKAIDSGGKVMVNCKVGASRSATLVLVYLMIKHHLTIQDATRLVRTKREICPNDGFLQQLCDFNEKLKKAGHFIHNQDEASANVESEHVKREEDGKGPHCVDSV
ncbi:dual specificity protein phosphatase 3-like [Pecten maximus]|uniref:dual specificity protein phosphatase 3-like n=1 Tax=Pecten maximus TaxID=6579 RepID=UPI0014587DDE|nr:dual specificity protein phosphatase 3-like [Pecten maximus]